MSDKPEKLVKPTDQKRKLLVLALGRSGAGISSSVKAMQDLGLFVIDNLPLKMIVPTIEAMEESGEALAHEAYAIGVHTYSVPNLEKLNEVKDKLQARFIVDVIFLKAKTEVLAKRFSASRRPHPFGGNNISLLEAIEAEKKDLLALEKKADLVINTTELNPHVLGRYLESRYLGYTPQRKLLVTVTSFGFKHKASHIFDLTFDVRFLKNPYFQEELRKLTGLSEDVANYVRSDERYDEFSKHVQSLIDFLLPQYYAEGKTYLRIGIGCTGGKHRSVTFARDLTKHLKNQNHSFLHINLDHLDAAKK